ncbi:MAG: hypothetical protein KIT36_21115 [Alphaproteobacteria bacterium]|nr:hypothetical protein [Alphaproteobacteria bacterium]
MAAPDDDGDPDNPIEVASPVCYAHEVDRRAHPPLSGAALAAFLNDLLEDERAGLRILSKWCLEIGQEGVVNAWTLAAMRDDAARICAGIWDHLVRVGVTPSSAVGAFHDSAASLAAWPERLRELAERQRRSTRRVRDALPRVTDAALTDVLQDLLARHDRNQELLDATLA